YRAEIASLQVDRRCRKVFNRRKFIVERCRKRCENGQQGLWRCRLNNQPLPVFPDNGVLTGQLELAGNSYGLITPIFEELDMPLRHPSFWQMQRHMSIRPAEVWKPGSMPWRMQLNQFVRLSR